MDIDIVKVFGGTAAAVFYSIAAVIRLQEARRRRHLANLWFKDLSEQPGIYNLRLQNGCIQAGYNPDYRPDLSSGSLYDNRSLWNYPEPLYCLASSVYNAPDQVEWRFDSKIVCILISVNVSDLILSPEQFRSNE